MKERPILFIASMVRALLEGRKTQTRRVVKFKGDAPKTIFPLLAQDNTPTGEWFFSDPVYDRVGRSGNFCPYGKPGDQLWVRETHAIMSTDGSTASVAYRERLPSGKTLADTDGGVDLIELSTEEIIWADAHIDAERWRPSIFMPRWASRILLEITEVRVERLNEISEADASGEGAGVVLEDAWDGDPDQYRKCYRKLWNQINGADSWDLNPWVWVVSFKVVKP